MKFLVLSSLGFNLIAAAFTAISDTGADYIDLGDSPWIVHNKNGSLSLNATIPGLIQTDLFAAGIIPDPIYGGKFASDDWIAEDEWTYSRRLPSQAPKGKKWSDFRNVYLVFEGLDTAAHIRIGGQDVGFANNMFRQWIFDVTNSFDGDALLEVIFESPIKYALQVFNETGSPDIRFANYAEIYPEGRQYIRKVQSDFGWDWGPHFAPQGIYRDAYLVGLDEGTFVTNTYIDIYKDGSRSNVIANETLPWVVNVSVDYLAANARMSSELGVEIAGCNARSQSKPLHSGINTIEVILNISEGAVERWWPAEFGKPTLYDTNISVALTPTEDPTSSISVVSFAKKAGFRTATLDLSPYDDRPGSHFRFLINGQIFNVKGSNMVPVDAFEHRVDRAWYRRLVESSIASNYNMLRLWSSGNYYSDDLYDVADELGILLWQDFQFSDNFYPAFPKFLENVRQEVRYQIRRLNRHPSLALWCGGNELESFNIKKLANNATYGESWFRNYTKLEEETIWPEVYDGQRSVSWLQDSVSQGYSFYNPETGVWINRYGALEDYSNPYYGPAEDYNLDIDQVFNNSKLPASRFLVEFGALSYDSLESYQTALPDSEILINGSTLLSRCYDGSPNVDQDLAAAISRYYILPNITSQLEFFDQFTWTTQIYHAEIMKYQIESFRRGISLPENTLGALIWQLNSPWTTLALNSIEYTGRWKVLQYVSQQVFERVVVSTAYEPSNETMSLWVASDAWEPVFGKVYASWYSWSGEALSTTTYDFRLDALSSKQLTVETGLTTIIPQGSTTNFSVLILKLSAGNEDGKISYESENFWVPNFLSNAAIIDPVLKVDKVGDVQWSVQATAGIAAYVWISAPNGVTGYWDQNAVFLSKGETRVFTFVVQGGGGNGTWKEGVRVRSLWDNYEV